MITIQERQTVKVPGITSLFVSFDFNRAIVDEIKLLDGCVFNAETKEWEMPLTNLAEFMDRCCIHDQINLQLLEYNEQETVKYQLSEYQTKPFSYQEDGIQFGLNHENWLLLDAPGLGKTLQLTYLAKELKERQGLQHCLIICGINTLKTNWKNEIEKHSNLSCRILGQRITKKGNFVVDGIQERLKQLKEPIEEFFVITNAESIRSDEILKLLQKGPNKFDMIVVDEIHKCFTYDTNVITDQGLLKIGDIVNKNIECNVLSYNHETKLMEYKPIINRFQMAHVSDLVELVFRDHDKERIIRCTPDHLIYTTNRGYVPACELDETDDILETNIV